MSSFDGVHVQSAVVGSSLFDGQLRSIMSSFDGVLVLSVVVVSSLGFNTQHSTVSYILFLVQSAVTFRTRLRSDRDCPHLFSLSITLFTGGLCGTHGLMYSLWLHVQ